MATSIRDIQFLLVGAVLFLGSSSVQAQWANLRGDTLVSAGATAPVLGASDTRSQVPIYEFLRLQTRDLGAAGLEVEFSGFAGAHLSDPPLLEPTHEDSRNLGQVAVGLLRYMHEKRGISLALGRQYLFAGAGRAEHLDGLSLQVRGPWHTDIMIFGGRTAPWQVDYQPDGGEPGAANEKWFWSNYAAGGKAHFRLLERGGASVGFVHEGHGSEVVRQCLVLDAGYWRSRFFEVLAGSTLDTVQLRPQEIWAEILSRPTGMLKLSVDYSFQVPALFLPKTSLFSVFTLDSHQEVSASATYGLTSLLMMGVEGGLRLFPEVDGIRKGFTAAASARLALGDIPGRALGARVEFLNVEEDRFLQGRLFSVYTFSSGLYASLELYLLSLLSQAPEGSAFQRRIKEHGLSVGGLGLLGYRFAPTLSAQVLGSGFSTPEAKHDLRVLGRFTVETSWGGPR